MNLKNVWQHILNWRAPFVSRCRYDAALKEIETLNKCVDYSSCLTSTLYDKLKSADRMIELIKGDKRNLNGRVELMRKACLIFEERRAEKFTTEEIELIRTMASQFNYMGL